MPASLDDKLVVAISSRALFDLEEENRIFDAGDPEGYMRLQLERLDVPARPGIAHSMVRKLLRFNEGAPRVEVVILSRNDPVSGMRVFRSTQHYGLPVQRGVFTRGRPPWRYLRPLAANLFLSTNEADVRQALAAGVPAARVYPDSARASAAHPDEVRIAFDGDACCSPTRPSASTRRRGWTPSRATNASAPPRRSRQGRSSRCSRRCTGCSANQGGACASAPRSSRRAARLRTNAPSAH